MPRLDDVKPAHCHARARRLVAELELIREEMGRTADTRPVPEVARALPRDCYFEGLATWHKADRLGRELGVGTSRPVPAIPALRSLKPGHVYELLERVLLQVEEIKARLQIMHEVGESAVDDERQPGDVLVVLIRANRALSAVLETPFTPSDVHRVVALASAYVARAGGTANPAPFERGKRPADCYARLQSCLAKLATTIGRRGEETLEARGALPEVRPTDVYDLASLVLGEAAFLHAITPDAAPIHAFEPGARAHRLPAHVDQLARTLEAQLDALR